MSATSEYERRSFKSEWRAERSGGERTIEGVAIAFNSRSVDLGGFVEYILPEAVDQTVRNGDVHAYYNHNSDRVLGYTGAGTLQIRKDRNGLIVKIYPPSSADDVMESIERGDVRGMSFGFSVVADDWRMENGIPTRYVTDMIVSEVSVVSKPAYPATSVQVAQRSLQSFLRTVRPEMDERLHRLRMAR
jgi:HK97 family phage prohead protease